MKKKIFLTFLITNNYMNYIDVTESIYSKMTNNIFENMTQKTIQNSRQDLSDNTKAYYKNLFLK